jgi:hypothetical protein
VHLVQYNNIDGVRIQYRIKRVDASNNYYLSDMNGGQLPHSLTKTCYVEAKLSDGISYASSDAIVTSDIPEPPAIGNLIFSSYLHVKFSYSKVFLLINIRKLYRIDLPCAELSKPLPDD